MKESVSTMNCYRPPSYPAQSITSGRASTGRAHLAHLFALAALGLSMILLCGCATPYRPMSQGKGHSDTPLASDRFKVAFKGNSETSPQRANDYAMLRAAQVSLQHGFGWFAVLDVTNTSSEWSYTARQQFFSDYPPNMGLPPPTPGGVDPYRFGYIVQYEQPRVAYEPGVQLLIQCYRTKPEKLFTYDAQALAISLKNKYKLQ